MIYKRTEAFRYTFEEPLAAKITIMDAETNESEMGECSIVNISPGGAMIFTKLKISTRGATVNLKFVLFQDEIMANAKVVWKKAYMDGTHYGVDFEKNESTEEKIIHELKFRRRKEVVEAKKM